MKGEKIVEKLFEFWPAGKLTDGSIKSGEDVCVAIVVGKDMAAHEIVFGFDNEVGVVGNSIEAFGGDLLE